MLGFDAESDGGEPVARDGELDDVHWFSLDEVRRAGRDEDPEPQAAATGVNRPIVDRPVARPPRRVGLLLLHESIIRMFDD